jgi:TolB protein
MLRVFRGLVILLLIFICGCREVPKYTIINHPFPSNEIIFCRYTGRIYGHIDKSEIWTMDRDGENQVKLGEISTFVGSISWSPDKKKIACCYKPKSEVCEIWMIEFGQDKIKSTKILRNDEYIGDISWSPDGKKIVFEMEVPKNNSGKIYVIDSNGKNLKRLTNYIDWEVYPIWSPDGKKIVFNRWVKGEGWKIYIMNADGTNVERLTNNPSFIEEGCPAWSSDGRWVAFQEKNPNKKIEERRHIVLINPKTKERFEIPPFPKPLCGYIPRMCFSPDGKKIAFQVDDYSKYDEYGKPNIEIYTIDIDGKNLKNLTNTPYGAEFILSWRPIAKK